MDERLIAEFKKSSSDLKVIREGGITITMVRRKKKSAREIQRGKKDYLNAKEFDAEMKKSVESDNLTPLAIEMLQRLISKISNSKKMSSMFRDLQEKEDCMSGAMEDIITNWKNYNVERANAFQYFTSIVKNGITKTWYKFPRNISLQSNDSNNYNF